MLQRIRTGYIFSDTGATVRGGAPPHGESAIGVGSSREPRPHAPVPASEGLQAGERARWSADEAGRLAPASVAPSLITFSHPPSDLALNHPAPACYRFGSNYPWRRTLSSHDRGVSIHERTSRKPLFWPSFRHAAIGPLLARSALLLRRRTWQAGLRRIALIGTLGKVPPFGASGPVQSSSTTMVFWAAAIIHRPPSLAIT